MNRNLLFLVLAVAAMAPRVNAQEPAMTIDVSKTGEPIHRYVYGQFTELLGNLYEKGIWAEMLSDRKFFYPVNSSNVLNPPNSKRNFNRWRPVGPDEFVTMKIENAYVGEHSPQVKLDGKTPHGISQSGLTLRKDKKYTGHIILSGDKNAKIEINLVWVQIPLTGRQYPSVRFRANIKAFY